MSINSPCPRGPYCKEEVRGPTWGLRQRKRAAVIPSDACFFSRQSLLLAKLSSLPSKKPRVQPTMSPWQGAGHTAGWGHQGQECGWQQEGMVTRTPSSPGNSSAFCFSKCMGMVGSSLMPRPMQPCSGVSDPLQVLQTVMHS